MNNTARVFRELRERSDDLSSRYKAKDKIAVGIRFRSGGIERAEAELYQLFELLHVIFEGVHPSTENMRKNEDAIASIFVVDSTGTTIYDSNNYRPSKNKYQLRTDKDLRVARFAGLSTEEREELVILTLEQIWGHIGDITEESNLDEPTSNDSLWGDMPWDA